MISKFVREQKRYSQDHLRDIFECSAEKVVIIIKKLKQYGVLKAVKASDVQADMSDLIDEEIEISDVELDGNNYYYVFTFVGIIAVEGYIIKSYPKYLTKKSPTTELKKIIKVLEKYNSKEQIIQMYNDGGENSAFNHLAVMLYLLNDYYENGLYTNTQDIIEEDGNGEILWDRTINETFAIIKDNRPYYTTLLTKKRAIDDLDYFKRLHECILSYFSKELKEADLIELFDIVPVDLTDEGLDAFGDLDYILYRIENELNVQYITRKELVLKSIYAYLTHNSSLSDIEGISFYGTSSFNLVWEQICSAVMDNQLQKDLGSLDLPVPLHADFVASNKLISLIEKPKWTGKSEGDKPFIKISKDTLKPDIISVGKKKDGFNFIIFDAKYYVIQLEENKKLQGQPGISDITKQYLYQLAFENFIKLHSIDSVKNCFLLPSEGSEIINKGYVKLDMLDNLGLQPIQIRMLPANSVYDYYLEGIKMDVSELDL